MNIEDTPLYLAVSLFLALTSVFFAAVIEARPSLFRPIFLSWLITGVSTAALGILGYFSVFPGVDLFTRYERAAILQRAAALLRERTEEGSDLITRESGLCKKDSLYEIGRVADVLVFGANEALRDDGQAPADSASTPRGCWSARPRCSRSSSRDRIVTSSTLPAAPSASRFCSAAKLG